VRILIAYLTIIFWIGVFGGYFVEHPVELSNHNPDVWIHGALAGAGTFYTIQQIVEAWRARRAALAPRETEGTK
jgi:hypothetical protein